DRGPVHEVADHHLLVGPQVGRALQVEDADPIPGVGQRVGDVAAEEPAAAADQGFLARHRRDYFVGSGVAGSVLPDEPWLRRTRSKSGLSAPLLRNPTALSGSSFSNSIFSMSSSRA